MNGRMKNLWKRIDRLNKRTVTREEGGLAQLLTPEHLAVLEDAKKRMLEAKVAQSEDGEKD